MALFLLQTLYINPRTYTQIHTPTGTTVVHEVKIARNSSFCPLLKNNPKISTLHEFSHKIYFYF